MVHLVTMRFRTLTFIPTVYLASTMSACPPPPGPAPVERGEATCEAACSHVALLKDDDGKSSCRGFRGTPGGGSCAQVCANAEEQGAVWPLACYVAAGSCAAVRSCPR